MELEKDDIRSFDSNDGIGSKDIFDSLRMFVVGTLDLIC